MTDNKSTRTQPPRKVRVQAAVEYYSARFGAMRRRLGVKGELTRVKKFDPCEFPTDGKSKASGE